MATFTLEKLREIADKKYAPTIIEADDGRVFTLPNILRMKPTNRKKVFSLIDKLTEDMDGSEETGSLESTIKSFKEILVVGEENGNGKQLVELLDDPALILEVATAWMEGTELGEAEL